MDFYKELTIKLKLSNVVFMDIDLSVILMRPSKNQTN